MTQEQISLEVNGLIIRGKLFVPDGQAKTQAVLFLHGWTGQTNTSTAALLAENGYYAMTFSFHGHNDSDGSFDEVTRKDALETALSAYDFFASKLPTDINIALVGNSFGSYIAVLVSAQRPTNGLSLRVPANYVDERFDQPQQDGQGHENPQVREWRQRKHDYRETMALRAIHDYDGKLQIIEAELDDVIPHQVVQDYADAYTHHSKEKLNYRLMPAWPHSLSTNVERNKQFQSLLLSWLAEL